MKARKLALVELFIVGIAEIACGESDGIITIRNYTTSQSDISNQGVNIKDYGEDLYLSEDMYPNQSHLFIKDSNDTQLVVKGKGINPNKTEIIKLYFVSVNVPPNIDHFIQLRIFSMGGLPADMNDYSTRNITLHQEPNNANADPNLYDIKNLTNWGTTLGYINFPTFEPAQWIFRSDNYADITGGENGLPDGRVDYRDVAKLSSYWANTSCDPNNHWCDFADLDRSGRVDFGDFALMSLEWFYDTNDPNTW
jgi:hypothetical protein